ncbi:hypothetical protein SDC9_168177 [bioreactor metagenome]|uniref:Uncharacterized protein n=1 Tax=bioreactor metagenome TaxID=1076179 RepID=A0A645G1T8_9ZZZZ
MKNAVNGFAHDGAVGLVETEHKRFVVLVHPGNHHEKHVWDSPFSFMRIAQGLSLCANFFLRYIFFLDDIERSACKTAVVELFAQGVFPKLLLKEVKVALRFKRPFALMKCFEGLFVKHPLVFAVVNRLVVDFVLY